MEPITLFTAVLLLATGALLTLMAANVFLVRRIREILDDLLEDAERETRIREQARRSESALEQLFGHTHRKDARS